MAGGRVVNTDAIPAGLRQRAQWVLWRHEDRDGRDTKVPYMATDPNRPASSTGPGTWSSFQQAVDAFEHGHADGIGYVFDDDDPFVGVDLDGELTPEQQAEIIDRLASYTERSPSGHGHHVFVRAEIERGRHPAGIGLFAAGRYFTVTGDHVADTPASIEYRQAELDAVLTDFLPAKPERQAVVVQLRSDLGDDDVVQKARDARNGHKFRALYDDGDVSGYASASEADLALCNHLTFWTQDAAQIDRLFRSSALMRPKWERDDYRDATISEAIDGHAGAFYDPQTAPAPAKPKATDQLADDGRELEGAEDVPVLRTRGVNWERVRPIRWLWHRRVPMGLVSLLVGEEGVGKGTLAAWLIARATLGELDGDLEGQPTTVLVVGDEDSFDPIWVPRLYAAGADLERVRTLDDGEHLDDLATAQLRLSRAVERDGVGFVVFDQMLDHVPGGQDGSAVYNPKHVRQALQPLRRVAAAMDVATLGLLHPIKGNPRTFRELLAGSHQFNAVSRSSLMLGVDPDDDASRVLVRGKGNHSAAPRSFEFTIAPAVLALNEHVFEVPHVVDTSEGDRTVQDLLKAGAAPVRDDLALQLHDLLTTERQTRAALAQAVGRQPKDGSVGNALKWLKDQGKADGSREGWKLA